jgi:cytochrome c
MRRLGVAIPVVLAIGVAAWNARPAPAGAPDPSWQVAQQQAAQRPATTPEPNALLARGEKLFAKCRACHSLEPGGRNKVGPRLHGLFGRTAGSVPDYRYSEALKKSGIVWNEQSLDLFLAGTTEMVPGTKMYAGLSVAQDRRALIAFLKQATAGPDPAPAAVKP